MVWKSERSWVRVSPKTEMKPGAVWLSLGGGFSIEVELRLISHGHMSFLPVVAHGLENGIIELDGSGDEERRTRHCGCCGACSIGGD